MDNSVYIVVAVLSVIFAGIAVFLFAIDRKVNKLEKKISEKYNHE